ncbi:MAG: nucleotide sugar dehydrogenase [Halobacteriovorax sp.]|nr:nucleotide sugar dehydrogenase [Halobacteriovorax sp.]|tara:strand:+ start:9879 stop:11300 length:1422 start_codon:yes stop_codon:yes gene_type:complete
MQSIIDELPKEFSRNLENRKVICIQGLGFVGAAMCAVVSNSLDENGENYKVIGVDLDGERVQSINDGSFPINTNDPAMDEAIKRATSGGNLVATEKPDFYSIADIVVMDINCDLIEDEKGKWVNLETIEKATASIAKRIKQECLLIVETTVPPGTCEKIILPILSKEFSQRGLDNSKIKLAHSYERVMPGKDYYDSIQNCWRVYSGLNQESSELCKKFLTTIINTKEFPLTELSNLKASETAKVLENSFRAANIAFIDEWSRFAESIGVNLFEVIDAIKVRPTHKNIMLPGFGVGGYCLTKDPYFAKFSAHEIFNNKELDFPFSDLLLQVNKEMPLSTFETLRNYFQGDLANKKVLLLGVSYREEVADTRYSASEIFYKEVKKHDVDIKCLDPLVEYWEETDVKPFRALPDDNDFDALIFSVRHSEFEDYNFEKWLDGKKPLIIDANNVLNSKNIEFYKSLGCNVRAIGRGDL